MSWALLLAPPLQWEINLCDRRYQVVEPFYQNAQTLTANISFHFQKLSSGSVDNLQKTVILVMDCMHTTLKFHKHQTNDLPVKSEKAEIFPTVNGFGSPNPISLNQMKWSLPSSIHHAVVYSKKNKKIPSIVNEYLCCTHTHLRIIITKCKSICWAKLTISATTD